MVLKRLLKDLKNKKNGADMKKKYLNEEINTKRLEKWIENRK